MNELLDTLFDSPEKIPELITGIKPILYSVAAELFSIYKDFENNEELRNLIAQSNWKDYKALVDAGFDPEQAMTIMLAKMEYHQRMADNIKASNGKKK